MTGDRVRCDCCGELYEPAAVGEGTTVLLWSDWGDLPAVLRPARTSSQAVRHEARERTRRRRAIAKRSRRAARRRG